MVKKLDLTPVKNFFFEKGEKLAAIVCAAAAVLLVGVGVMSGMSAQSAPGTNQPFDKVLKEQARRLDGLLAAGTEVPPLPPSPYAGGPWTPVSPTFQPGQYFYTIDVLTNKRNNPTALAALVDPEKKQIQMDYVRGPIEVYEINVPKQWATTLKPAATVVDPKVKQPKNVFNANANALVPITTVDIRRMIVVHATFPLEQQIEEFRRALRMMNQADLWQLQKDLKDPAKVTGSDLPKFLGINVMKAEESGGQFEWTPLVRHDWAKDALEVDPALMAMLRAAVFDDPLQGAAYAFQGLIMPLPKLAGNFTYPALDLPGIVNGDMVAPGVGPGVGPGPGVRPPMVGPGGPAMGGVGGKGEDLDTRTHWSLLAPEYKDRFFGQFYVLDPLGVKFDSDDPKDKDKFPAFVPPRGGQGNQAGASPFAGNSPYAASKQWNAFPYPIPPQGLGPNGQPLPPPNNVAPMNMGKPYDALIRFVDVDVVPGKTYKYSIQVRIANPNFGKKGEVAQAAFADLKELAPAPPVETPTFTVPEEYFVYATDQKPVNPKVPGGSDTDPAKADQVAVQIHRWLDTTTDAGIVHKVGDWVIAERLLVRRGDPIGRTIHVEVPVWNAKLRAFGLVAALGAADPNDPNMMKKGPDNKGFVPPPKDLGLGKLPPKKKEVGEKGSMGIPVDFTEGTPPAVLADFDGGKQAWTPRGSSTPYKDESASNLLILRPDGRLIIRNNRADSDENTDESKIRRQRVNDWDQKAAALRTGTVGAVPDPRAPNPLLMPKKN